MDLIIKKLYRLTTTIIMSHLANYTTVDINWACGAEIGQRGVQKREGSINSVLILVRYVPLCSVDNIL